MDNTDTTEYALAFDLDATQGPGLRFTYDDCERARSLAIIFEKNTPNDAYDIFTTLGDTTTQPGTTGTAARTITRPAFDAAIRRLAPHAKSLSEAKRLYLSESLDCVWNQYVQMMENNEDNYTFLPGNTSIPVNGGSTPITELIIGFSMLCKGSKSDKLQFAWNLLDTDHDGALTRQQFWQLLRSILIMLLSISTMGREIILQRQEFLTLTSAEQNKNQQRMIELNTTAQTIRDWIDDMAVEATQTFFAADTTLTTNGSSSSNQPLNGQDRPVQKALLTFVSFGDIYNNGGHLLLPFLELLDSRKWPVTPLSSSSSLSAVVPPPSSAQSVPVPPQPTVIPSSHPSSSSQPPIKATVSASSTKATVAPPIVPPSVSNHYTVQEPETDEEEIRPETEFYNETDEDEDESHQGSVETTDDENYLREWTNVNTASGVPEPSAPTIVSSETTVPSSSGGSSNESALYFQLLTQEDGAAIGLGPVELRIRNDDIVHYITFLEASGLNRIQSEHVLYAALEACEHGMPYLTMEAFMRTIALLLTTNTENKDEKKQGTIPDTDMRMIVTALTNIFSTLSYPDGESDVLDVLMTLLPFAAGSKTEKLRWAWRLLDENLENSSVIDTNENENGTPTLRVHSLGRREIWRALRGILISILVMCRGKFMNSYEIPKELSSCPPNYIPEPISDEEAKEIQSMADAVAIAGTTSIFHETADFRMDSNTITLEELSVWYNNGGYKAVPWLELLNTQKWVQHFPGTAPHAPSTVIHSSSTTVTAQPVDTDNNTKNNAYDESYEDDDDVEEEDNDAASPEPEPEIPEDDVSSSYTDGDTVITRVSGAKIVIQMGLNPNSTAPEDQDKDTSSSSRWYFSTLACDLVRHISEISGLYNVSVTQISRIIQQTVKSTNGNNKSSGQGKHMINLETYNACIRVLIPVARLTRPDRQHLSRLFGSLFDALDTTRTGIVDWRDISIALSIYAGKGSKSDKIVHAFDLYRRHSYTKQGEEGPSQVNKDGLFRYLRAFFTSLAVIQESGAELDLALQCMMYNGREPTNSLHSSPASMSSNNTTTSPLGLPTSIRIGLRTRSQRTAQVSMAANAFTRTIFNEINTANNVILKNAGYNGSHEWRMIAFTDLAELYNEGGGHSTMSFFELLAIPRWLNFVIPVPDFEMRMVLSYAAASPLTLAAEAHEAIHEVEELRAAAYRVGVKPDLSSGNDDYYNEDSEEDDELAAVAADVAQEKAEYERFRKQNHSSSSYPNGLGTGSTGSNHVREESAIDEGGLDGDEESETGSSHRIDGLQSARAKEVIARMFATPVFSFALPRIDAEGNTSTAHEDGHGVSENTGKVPNSSATASPFLLTLLPKDCAALQRVLFTGRLDSVDSDALLTLLRSASRDGTYITRSAYTSCVGRLLPNSSAGVPLQDLMWTEAALQAIFTAYDRFGHDAVPLSDIACGLLLLCTGNKSQKLAAAWPLFDENNDGNLDLPELTALLHAFLVMLFVIKAWGKVDTYEAMMTNVNYQIVSDTDYDAITAAVIALGDAAYRGSISLESVAERTRNISIPFIAFGNFYNRLAANTVVSSKDSTGGSEDYFTENEQITEFLNIVGIEPESFMWLELLDVRKYPTTSQMAMQAANMVNDLEAQEQETRNNNTNGNYNNSYDQVSQTSASTDSAYAYVRLPESDPNEDEEYNQGNEQPEEEPSSATGTTNDSKNPLTSLPGMRPVYTLQLTTTGDTLLVSELDLYAMQRVSYISPLARMSPDDLISLLSAYVSPDGMITRQAFNDIVTGIIEEASETVLEAFGTSLVNQNDNGPQNRLAARAALRDCSMLGDMLMRIFELLDTDGTGAVDAIEFIPALTLLTDGIKSTKLSSAWRLRAGSDDGRLGRVDVASFLACFLLAVYGVTCAGDELSTDTIREIVVRAASESSRFIFLLANLNRQQNGEPVPTESENDTISFADFASFYNGSTAATRDLGFSGFLIVPYLELLDPRKWTVPSLQQADSTKTNTNTTTSTTASSVVENTVNEYPVSANDDGNEEDEEDDNDDEENGNEEDNDDNETEDMVPVTSMVGREPSSETSVPSSYSSASVQPVNGNEVIYGFVLTSDRSRLNLTRDDVGNFLDFVISSGFHRLSSDRIIRTILNQAEMSTTNENSSPDAIPQMYGADYNDAIGELLDAAFAERHRANSIDLTAAASGNEQAALMIEADLDIAQSRLEDLFNAFVDRHSGTADGLEIALGLGMLVGGTGRKSDKLVAGWQAAALATGGVLHLQKNNKNVNSSFSSGTGQLTLTRPVFVSFLRAILITLMVFGHVELIGQGNNASSSGPRRHGVFYLLATEAADDIAQHVFSTLNATNYDNDEDNLDDAEITLDAFASFYNDHGWESAGFLELLDLSKWGPSLPSALATTNSSAKKSTIQPPNTTGVTSPKQSNGNSKPVNDGSLPSPGKASLPSPSNPNTTTDGSSSIPYGGGGSSTRPDSSLAPSTNRTDTSRSSNSPPSSPSRDTSVLPQSSTGSYTDETMNTALNPTTLAQLGGQRFQFELLSQYPLYIMGADVESLAFIRNKSNLPSLSASVFLDTLIKVCVPGYDSKINGPFDGSIRIDYDTFRNAVRSLVPGSNLSNDEKHQLSKEFLRLYFCLEEYTRFIDSQNNNNNNNDDYDNTSSSTGGVPFADIYTALLYLINGAKTEKLLNAFYIYDTNHDDALTISQCTSLIRSLLIGILAFRSNAHMDVETDNERKTVDALVSIASKLGEIIFNQAVTEVGELTFTEFGTFYNGGGFVALPFIELLDWKKISGETIVHREPAAQRY